MLEEINNHTILIGKSHDRRSVWRPWKDNIEMLLIEREFFIGYRSEDECPLDCCVEKKGRILSTFHRYLLLPSSP
jgi:hypothetical protein